MWTDVTSEDRNNAWFSGSRMTATITVGVQRPHGSRDQEGVEVVRNRDEDAIGDVGARLAERASVPPVAADRGGAVGRCLGDGEEVGVEHGQPRVRLRRQHRVHGATPGFAVPDDEDVVGHDQGFGAPH